MPIRVNTNIGSINAQRKLGVTEQAMQKSIERLSSGLRINRAADDAAGLAVTSKMRAEVKGMSQAVRNANDGISMIQTAEGSMEEVYNILSRMRELSEQAATGTLGQDERDLVDLEFVELHKEIDRISSVTRFNGTPLLDGSISTAATAIQLQVGVNNTSSDRIGIQIDNLSSSSMGLGPNGTITTLSSQAMAQSALDIIDSAIGNISANRGRLGAQMNRLESTVSNLNITIENTNSSISRIRDVDFAAETANYTQHQILLQAGTSILAQANQIPQSALSLLQ